MTSSPPETGNDALRLYVSPAYEAYRRPIGATLACLLEIAGWRVRPVDSVEAADVAYLASGDATSSGHAAMLAGAPPEAWAALGASTPVRRDGAIVPSAAVLPAAGTDWVAAGAFLLWGLHEHDPAILESRDPWATPGPGIARWGLDARPAVQEAAAALGARVRECFPARPPASRWPTSKRWALVMSHDLDRYRRFRPTDFARDAVSAMARLRPDRAATALAKVAASVAGRAAGEDPYARSLRELAALQRELGMRSTIYVAALGYTDAGGDPLDVTYSLRDQALVGALKHLASEGWELGLHSSYNAWREPAGFRRERDRLAQAIGREVEGVRGHYWSLDRSDATRSLREIAGAGFTYDSSLGMNQVHGYRRGANYPYRAFDERTGDSLDLWEVPPVMMDQSVLLAGGSNAARTDAVRARVSEVRDHQGLLVLDWHTDAMVPGYMDGSTAVLTELLRDAAADPSCWVATAREVVQWCATDRWAH